MQEEYQETVLKIFKTTFDQYKENNQKGKKKEAALYESVMKDDMVFNNIKKAFKILSGIIKFCVLREKEYYEEFVKNISPNNSDEIINVEINFPKNEDELVCFFVKYPKLIDLLQDDLYEIISMEHYEGLCLINNINPMLYYSVIDQEGFSEKIEFFEQDYEEFYNIIKCLIKKTLKLYIEMVKDSADDHLNVQE